ncbi:MAG TPA: hypothetical protein VEF76_12350 [Patescibacteria group bacterium]|nr:hypothetical protein [Patescibacteria group bacterium]
MSAPPLKKSFFQEAAFFLSNVAGQEKIWPAPKIFVGPFSGQPPKMWYALAYQVTRFSAFTCISKRGFSFDLNGLARRVEAENNKKKNTAKYYGEMNHV